MLDHILVRMELYYSFTPSNIAFKLQPARTDGLVSGIAKFFFGHGSCREEAITTPSKNFSHA